MFLFKNLLQSITLLVFSILNNLCDVCEETLMMYNRFTSSWFCNFSDQASYIYFKRCRNVFADFVRISFGSVLVVRIGVTGC